MIPIKGKLAELPVASYVLMVNGHSVEPEPGEEFVGIPPGWYEDGTPSFLEVRVGGECVRSVNTASITTIEFKQEETNATNP